MRRLAQAGFPREFVRAAILPDWWDDSCAEDPSLLAEVELRVARFLDRPLSEVSSPEIPLTPALQAGLQLRRGRELSQERLAPAIHAALKISAVVLRNLRDVASDAPSPPASALEWRARLQDPRRKIRLQDLLTDLWRRGIPVIPLAHLPSPRFQGAACIVGGRPVVLLGHQQDEPGRVAFVVAHEAAHIAAGDCGPDRPVIDEEEGIQDSEKMEQAADRYATQLLAAGDSTPTVEAASFKELANKAAQIESETGADAGMVIFGWAARTGDYATAVMAVKALYRATGARRELIRHFAEYVAIEDASETDRELLRCIGATPEPDETAP